jgi:hypothetical protein
LEDDFNQSNVKTIFVKGMKFGGFQTGGIHNAIYDTNSAQNNHTPVCNFPAAVNWWFTKLRLSGEISDAEFATPRPLFAPWGCFSSLRLASLIGPFYSF